MQLGILFQHTAKNSRTGSSGIVVNLIDDHGPLHAPLSMDRPLCPHLNAVLVGEQTSQINDSLRNKRTTPQMRENLREVMNILKGVCQIHLGQPLEFDNIAFRGDGQLRTPYWKSVLAGPSFRAADRHFMAVKLAGVGSETLSI